MHVKTITEAKGIGPSALSRDKALDDDAAALSRVHHIDSDEATVIRKSALHAAHASGTSKISICLNLSSHRSRIRRSAFTTSMPRFPPKARPLTCSRTRHRNELPQRSARRVNG